MRKRTDKRHFEISVSLDGTSSGEFMQHENPNMPPQKQIQSKPKESFEIRNKCNLSERWMKLIIQRK